MPLMRRYSPFRISALVLAFGWVPLAVAERPALSTSASGFGWIAWLGFALRHLGPRS